MYSYFKYTPIFALLTCVGCIEEVSAPYTPPIEVSDSGTPEAKASVNEQYAAPHFIGDDCWQCVPGGKYMNVCSGTEASPPDSCIFCGNHIVSYSCHPDPAKNDTYRVCDCFGCQDKLCEPDSPAVICQLGKCINQ